MIAAMLAQSSEVAAPSASLVLHSYLHVFVIAFLVTIICTPIIRRIAIYAHIVDWPGERKDHREPVAYLGGVAVFLGLMVGIGAGYMTDGYREGMVQIPYAVVIAMFVIMITGLADDIFHWDPNLKLAGQFVAAAALALNNQIGEKVAEGLLRPFERMVTNAFNLEVFSFAQFDVIPGTMVWEVDLVYWAGALIIAVFVIGGCNAANLLDGMDGLLSGTVSIMAAALLAISVTLAALDHGVLSGARVILCFALLGATLGFLPHNFKPATIFLGDAGSLLLGFSVIVIILLMGEQGQTHLVFAGLIVFGLPIVDTSLAIIRRKLNGLPIFTPDSDHLHHMLKRAGLGTVGSVLVLYGITLVFATLAITLVFVRARVVYALVLVLGGFIVVTGIKAARSRVVQDDIARLKAGDLKRRRAREKQEDKDLPPKPDRPGTASDPTNGSVDDPQRVPTSRG